MSKSFTTELLDGVADPGSRAYVLGVLAAWHGRTVYISAVSTRAMRRREIARQMLAAKECRNDIVNALARRFGVSRRQANDDVSEAQHGSFS